MRTSRTVPASSPAPTVEPLTGIGDLDRVLSVVLAGDRIESAVLTGYQLVACAREPQGDRPPPVCRGNEADGQQVEVFPVIGCAPQWVRPEQVPDLYHYVFAERELQADGVYRPKAGVSPYAAEFIAVIRTGVREDGVPAGAAVHVFRGRIVALEGDCGDLRSLLRPERIDTPIVETQSGEATPATQ